MTPMMHDDFNWDPASFRDPAGSVFFEAGSVYRSIASSAVHDVKKLLGTTFFKKLMRSGDVIQSDLIENTFNVPGEFVLYHQKIPMITYPYEWSFQMLKDAALLTLNILKACIQNGFILKDGTAWNVTHYNARMVFFDVLSIEPYQEGQSWNGYQQFCQEFLNPLFLKCYKNLDFNDYFKGSLCGIDTRFMNKIFHLGDLCKPGVFKHIFLNAQLISNKKIASSTINKKHKLPKIALLGLINNLLSLIKKLNLRSSNSVWIDYVSKNTYESQDEIDKKDFIRRFSSNFSCATTIVDFGCNTGKYSYLASELHNVISCDIDADCIDAIYKKSSNEKNKLITPMVLNLMNPSPNVGWDLTERKSIYERLKVDGFLSLALIHHICIANNVPIKQFLKFLSKVAVRGVLEWVEKDDPMVVFLLRNREDIFETYTWENFLIVVNQYFTLKEVKIINGGHRKLCWLEKK